MTELNDNELERVRGILNQDPKNTTTHEDREFLRSRWPALRSLDAGQLTIGQGVNLLIHARTL